MIVVLSFVVTDSLFEVSVVEVAIPDELIQGVLFLQ